MSGRWQARLERAEAAVYEVWLLELTERVVARTGGTVAECLPLVRGWCDEWRALMVVHGGDQDAAGAAFDAATATMGATRRGAADALP
jgi:hypothetical protein